MKARNGIELELGSRCVLLVGDESGEIVWVHKLKPLSGIVRGRFKVMVVNTPYTGASLTELPEDSWWLSSWCRPEDLSVVDEAKAVSR